MIRRRECSAPPVQELPARQSPMGQKNQKHTTPGIRWSSPTQLLIQPSMVYVQGSGRDPQLSIGYGRMYYLGRTSQVIYEYLMGPLWRSGCIRTARVGAPGQDGRMKGSPNRTKKTRRVLLIAFALWNGRGEGKAAKQVRAILQSINAHTVEDGGHPHHDRF